MKKLTTYVDDHGEKHFHKEEDLPPSRFKEGKGYLLLANDRRIHLPFKVALIETGLKESDMRKLLFLASYLDKNNSLQLRSRSMTPTDMSELLSITLNQVYILMRRLIVHKVATRYEGVFYFNPLIVTINRYITPVCYRAWDEYLADHLSTWAVNKLEGAAPVKIGVKT